MTSKVPGLRKVFIAMVIIGVVVAVGPALSETQARVLEEVTKAMLYSNAAVHVARAIGGNKHVEKIRNRFGGGPSPTPGGAGSPEKPWEGEPGGEDKPRANERGEEQDRGGCERR